MSLIVLYTPIFVSKACSVIFNGDLFEMVFIIYKGIKIKIVENNDDFSTKVSHKVTK
jgi:hypothetical protein